MSAAALTKFYESIGGGSLQRAATHVSEFGSVVRAGGESAVVGGGLGYLAATLKNGLDAPIPGTTHVAPIDGIVALGGLGAAVLMAHTPVASDLRNMGAAAAAILAYRKGKEFTEHHAATSAATKGALPAHGEMGAEIDDPIVAIAHQLG
jgi:hypothetical protein